MAAAEVSLGSVADSQRRESKEGLIRASAGILFSVAVEAALLTGLGAFRLAPLPQLGFVVVFAVILAVSMTFLLAALRSKPGAIIVDEFGVKLVHGPNRIERIGWVKWSATAEILHVTEPAPDLRLKVGYLVHLSLPFPRLVWITQEASSAIRHRAHAAGLPERESEWRERLFAGGWRVLGTRIDFRRTGFPDS